MRILIATLFMSAAISIAQQVPPPQAPPTPGELEQEELKAAITDANQSSVDLIRLLEAFIVKHPHALQLRDIETALARAAIDTHDDRRTVLYGERLLATSPDDLLVLDRVAKSLLVLGGRENAAKSLNYSTVFADKVLRAPPVDGKDAARKQDERDRALARALLFQSQAERILGEKQAAERVAAKSFAIYPAEDSAREWAETLEALGRADESIERLADAFAISDVHAAGPDRVEDRERLGEQYRKVHGSEKGLGEVVLAAFDRMTARLEERRLRLHALDPNVNETEPMHYTITALDGNKLTMASLKGSVVIMDFWATWCGPCRIQHPLYEEVKRRFKNRPDVVFLSIDADEDRTLVAPFLEKMQWSKSIYFEDGLQRLLQVSSIPTTVLFDKQGRVASRMMGFLPDKFVDQLSERIQAILADTH
jgi:thiol-disulfide isomerase/thioredoxin